MAGLMAAKCQHRWVLGEVVGQYSRWVLKREAKCRKCGRDKLLREREHFTLKDDDEG